MLNVICVQTGNYLGRGEEYVRLLKTAIERNITVPHRFVCVTDHFIEGVWCMSARFEGWWEKLHLFKRGMFEGRCMYLDLDTAIVGNLGHIAAYDGEFATLHDFWRGRNGLGPAVIMWQPGPLAESIYDEWQAQGFPKQGNGDQSWIENLDQGRFHKRIDILQTLYPGAFVSYKEHCTSARRGWRGDLNDQIPPPDGARVVCFHGRPRPHEVGGWVRDYWKEGVSLQAA